MRVGIWLSFVLTLAIGLVLAWLALSPKPNVAVGKALYATHCAKCHGANLEGQPNWQVRDEQGYLPAPPHDASGHTWHHPDQQLFDITKFGTARFAPEGYQTNMQGYEKVLKDHEIWSILEFIKSTWAPEILARQQKITSRSK